MKINGVTSNAQVQSQLSSNQKIVTRDKIAPENSKVDVQDSNAGTTRDEFISSDGLPIDFDAKEENEFMEKSVNQANQSLKMYDRKLELAIHEVTHTVMYTLRDTKTNEVIAEFPPKKIQDMIAKMWELAGLFVDKKA